ncbi:hypothetical protein HYFRA_00006220 [Hymenoscyphus fraxineus]|uniref:NADPH--cytochrome P450 reductase n=1 Tax=Hymenoscyphus fraxineus TaxID=746836 RepID=A0A9N9LAV1_9HELO|nr:hypothetical protein HYFRA_00006220 [Hymenoscyphus fraxineus]
MAQLDTLDLVVLAAICLGTIAYFTKGTYWGIVQDPYASTYSAANGSKAGKTRNIVEKMEETNKNCVIFYGSQTGTAEDYASRLAKEGKSRFGLETMVADLEDYDFDNLDAFPEDKVVMFILATYGEGEPTDNAVDFYEFIYTGEPTFSQSADPPLGNLTYVAFGLGNNTYEHYNSMVRNVDSALTKLGAHRIGAAGEGDDGAGTMEEDFLAWKDPMWAELSEKMGLEEREAVYEPVFAINEREDLTTDSPEVYLGEPNKMHLEGSSKGPFNAHNPYIAPIAESHELFSVKDRNCLHMEIDISGSNLSYQTGDHIAIWPTNSGKEVDRFLSVTGLLPKRHSVVSVKPLDSTAKVPFPTPTTFDAVIRYHMEICAPVSRQFISTLAPFAPNEDAKAEMAKLGSDKEYFSEKIAGRCLNIAQALQAVGGAEKWTNIPFSAFIEGINKIQPRYYSISSSSLVQKTKISITAVVESTKIAGREDALKGVTTNYLLALKQKQHGDPTPDPHGLTYEITGPRNKYDGVHVPIHVRHSNFKLPSDPSKPVIMVGPGTGVAPFRAFVQERAQQAKNGEDVGKTILFFGCRKESEDFMYASEWEQYKKDLGDKFELITAFSRDGPKKVYVQHRLEEHAKEINELLQKKAYFYVCGDAANMAREVNLVLGKIISKERGIPETKAEEIVKGMRSANQYQITMSYQQTASHSETNYPPRPASAMYAQPQIRTPRENQTQPTAFAQGHTPAQGENLSAMMNQFAGLALPNANMASAAAAAMGAQLPSMQYYLTAEGQYLMAPTGLYSQQPMAAAPTQLADGSYNPYQAALPYLAGAYPGYVPGYPTMLPYAGGARAGYYPDRSEHSKDVPALENRRGSYSTNESAPSTPYYGALSQREQAGTHIAAVDRSVFGSTPSPQQLAVQHPDNQNVKPLQYKTIPINVDVDALLAQSPPIPRAVPAVFTPRESMRTLDQSLSNPIAGNRNVYIRGLHPNTDDETLAAYAARFGKIETSKAIIDTSTGACKGFGFAKYHNVRDSELCIRGFYKLGYEVGFARVNPTRPLPGEQPTKVKQESFNSRLKAEGDESSTNLYVSNLPKAMTESELGAIFMDYTVSSSRILRDSNNNSRGVGFARFESREVCEEIIKKFHGQPIGEDGLLLQVRYADTPAQKDLKRITTERRQFRTNEYNVGAYGTASELTLSPPIPSPLLPRTSMLNQHIGSTRSEGTWKREEPHSTTSSTGGAPIFKDIDRQVKVELTEATPNKSSNKQPLITTPTISEDGSADDTVQYDAPPHSGSPTARKS